MGPENEWRVRAESFNRKLMGVTTWENLQVMEGAEPWEDAAGFPLSRQEISISSSYI